jgi:flagellar protein FliO/FliZ
MEDVSLLALLGRLIVSLAVVFGLMLVAGRVLRRRAVPGGAAVGRGTRIEVLARQGLTRSASVALVRVGGKSLVLGITDASVSVLGEADADLVELELQQMVQEAESRSAARPDWKSLVEMARERTVRH